MLGLELGLVPRSAMRHALRRRVAVAVDKKAAVASTLSQLASPRAETKRPFHQPFETWLAILIVDGEDGHICSENGTTV